MHTITITVHKDKRILPAERPTIAYNELVTLLFRFPGRVELDKYTSWELALDSDMRFYPGEDGLLAYSDEYTLDTERNTIMFALNTRTAKFRDLVNGLAHNTKIYLQLSAREGTDTPVHMVLDYVLASSIVNDAQGDPGTVPDLRSEMQGLVDAAVDAKNATLSAKDQALSAVGKINLETLAALSGTEVTVAPWTQSVWSASGTCSLTATGWAVSGHQVAYVLITLAAEATLSISGASVADDDALSAAGTYACYLINENGTVRFKVAGFTEAA